MNTLRVLGSYSANRDPCMEELARSIPKEAYLKANPDIQFLKHDGSGIAINHSDQIFHAVGLQLSLNGHTSTYPNLNCNRKIILFHPEGHGNILCVTHIRVDGKCYTSPIRRHFYKLRWRYEPTYRYTENEISSPPGLFVPNKTAALNIFTPPLYQPLPNKFDHIKFPSEMENKKKLAFIQILKKLAPIAQLYLTPLWQHFCFPKFEVDTLNFTRHDIHLDKSVNQSGRLYLRINKKRPTLYFSDNVRKIVFYPVDTPFEDQSSKELIFIEIENSLGNRLARYYVWRASGKWHFKEAIHSELKEKDLIQSVKVDAPDDPVSFIKTDVMMKHTLKAVPKEVERKGIVAFYYTRDMDEKKKFNNGRIALANFTPFDISFNPNGSLSICGRVITKQLFFTHRDETVIAHQRNNAPSYLFLTHASSLRKPPQTKCLLYIWSGLLSSQSHLKPIFDGVRTKRENDIKKIAYLLLNSYWHDSGSSLYQNTKNSLPRDILIHVINVVAMIYIENIV